MINKETKNQLRTFEKAVSNYRKYGNVYILIGAGSPRAQIWPVHEGEIMRGTRVKYLRKVLHKNTNGNYTKSQWRRFKRLYNSNKGTIRKDIGRLTNAY